MNHHCKLLQSLYSTASGKYLKFKNRFDKAIHTGRFYKLNKRKQSSVVGRLKRLYDRLKSLQTQLRLVGAGATLAITLAVNDLAHAQSSLGPFDKNDASNPLPPPFFIDRPRLAVVDIDNDGDLDIFAGTQNGDIEFFRNSANVAGPKPIRRFIKVTGSSNPLDGVNEGSNAAPAFADVDGDGDFDMLLGTGYGYTFFFKNTGSKTNPIFVEQTGTNNPFDGITGTTNKYGIDLAIPVFVDIDGDGDQDLFIGSSYSYDYYGSHDAVQFFENTGGNFAPAAHNLTNYLRYFNSAAMTFADVDENGELDVLVSDGFGPLQFFVECSTEFCKQTVPWDPVTRTGNPMHNIYFSNGSPVLADFDGDGDLDLVVGQYSSAVTNLSVRYFENIDGAFTFKNQDDLNLSPLGGVDVGEEAAPVFVDLDNDGDLDAVIGAKYNFGTYGTTPEILVYIRNANGEFIADISHPLRNTTRLEDVIPVFADIDNDGDQDYFYCYGYGGYGASVVFFRNNNGSFIKEIPSLFPTLNYSNAKELSLAFVDVDNDGDLDAIFGNNLTGQPRILYFQNTGTASAPIFVQATPPAPFGDSIFQNYPNVSAVDLDHDGDTDIVISETYYSGFNSFATRVRFFRNNGDGTFTEESAPIIANGSPKLGFTSFTDIDGDGDLDAFMGNGFDTKNGTVTYFKNTNPAPTTQFPTTVLPVDGGAATLIFPSLILTDTDNDKITEAIVSIANFRVGDETLTFTPQSGITGSFNASTGVLTLTGLATVATYQTALRSITYQFIGTPPTTSGRLSAGRIKVVTLNRSISIGVLDQDLTSIIPNALAVQVSFPDPNQPPVITSPTGQVAVGNTIDLDFSTLISDPNSNLDASSFKVIQDPISGATYTITGLVVKLDYAGRSFTGLDQFTVEICDLAGSCSTSVVTVEVIGELTVYNGFSPNGDAYNPYFEIANIELLEPKNKVSIYNRWGDLVFDIENYDNDTRRFEGKNNNGNELPSGTYFYKIEFSSGEELSGYLTIKK